ncbi:MAG: glycosyltransferase family 4 protein [Desulfotignum sp.]|nr:glycosyltransferase family 4 protein [Desulfotignum sp.]
MNSHYKIIHTTCHTQWGGLEKRIFNESVWMRDNGHQVLIAAPKNTPLYLQSKQHGFKTYGVDFKKLQMVTDYKFLRHVFAIEQPDIVNTHGNEDSRIALLAAFREKIGCRILSRHISAHIRKSWHNRLIYKKYANYIFTTADYTTRYLKTVFKLTDKQIFSMPSGIIPPQSLVPQDDARNRLIHDLGLATDIRFIGFVGRVSEAKGIVTLFNAFEKLADTFPLHHLVLVGDSSEPYFQYLKKMARDMALEKRIHILGPKKDVWPLYRAFDCKVLASKDKNGSPFEGVPQALLEAMYFTCPVIGSFSGGIPDIIQHGKTGLLFSNDDANALSLMILQTLSDKDATQQRVKTASERVEKHHTLDAMGKKILRIYALHHQRAGNDGALMK